MDTEEIYSMTLSEIEHHGIKGQKWGVRRPRGANGKVSKSDGPIRRELKSVARELGTGLKSLNAHKMSDSELKAFTKRARLENQLKRASKAQVSPVQKIKVRKEYTERKKLSDEDLFKRVQRLNLESNMRKEATSATKEQRAAAKNLIEQIGSMKISDGNGGKQTVNQATAKAVSSALVKAMMHKPPNIYKR